MDPNAEEKKEQEVQEYLLLIMNCKKYRAKATMQKKTWLRNIPAALKYYHVIGDLELTHQFIFDEEEKILYVKTPDDYISLPKKVISAYEAVNKTFQYKYILKTDDDQNLINMKFIDMVLGLTSKAEPKFHYGGHIVDVEQNYYSKYHTIHPELPKDLPVLITKYCNGRFYFLSKEDVEDLLTKKYKIWKEYLEDYAIGYNLDKKMKEHVLNLQTHLYLKDII